MMRETVTETGEAVRGTGEIVKEKKIPSDVEKSRQQDGGDRRGSGEGTKNGGPSEENKKKTGTYLRLRKKLYTMTGIEPLPAVVLAASLTTEPVASLLNGH